MKKCLSQFGLFAVLGAVTGCGAAARSPEQYRDDTAALLETRNPNVKQCYDEVLKSDAHVSGKVAIRFTVKEDTGDVISPAIDAAGTTAPEPLAQCIVQAVTGLKLQPPDAHDGNASFVYEFTVNAPATAVVPDATAAPPPPS